MKKIQELTQIDSKQLSKITFIFELSILAHLKSFPTLDVIWLPNHWQPLLTFIPTIILLLKT